MYISEIIAHLSGAERRTALGLLGHLVRVRKQAHEALLAQADDILDLALLSQAGPLTKKDRAAAVQRGEALRGALDTALMGLHLVGGALAVRCPIPDPWAHLGELRHLIRGQRETLYQADIWEHEVIQPIQADHARVVAEMEELRRQLRGTAPRGEPGRKPKYPESVIKLVRKLLAQRKVWKDVYQRCKEKFPKVDFPKKRASFVRAMQRSLADSR
jgi:hypothetical protein